MRISQKLIQFENETALFIVTGHHDGIFYVAKNGLIRKVASFHVEKPHYSDREGFFEKRRYGKVFGSGSVYEPKKDVVARDFRRQFLEHIDLLMGEYNFSRVFFFSPPEAARTKKLLPADLRRKLEFVFRGNYCEREHHPFELIEKVADRRTEKQIRPLGLEAKKILEKSTSFRKKTRR